MDYDTVLAEIGGFGKFQLKILALICLPVLYGAANAVSYVFISRSPEYRCFVPQCEQLEGTQYDQEWLQYALPGAFSGGKFVPEECFKYTVRQNGSYSGMSRNNTCNAESFSEVVEKCKEWIFTNQELTMITTWPEELACSENEWKLALLGTSNFAGVMIGSAVFGFLADYYGRRKIFVISIAFMSLNGTGQALSTSYLMLIIFTFLNAVGTAGIYFPAFVLIIEMIDKNRREMSSVLLNYFFSFGGVMVGVIAYFDPNWRNMTLWIAAPPIIFVFNYWLIPESICWLISNESYSSAYKIVKKAAKDNKKVLSMNTITKFEGTNVSSRSSSEDSLNEVRDPEKKSKTNYLTLLKSKKLIVRILILCFVWGTNSMVFYGLSLYSVNLSGNIYLNFIFGSLIEIPGNTIAWISMNRVGRRYPLVVAFLICGSACVWGAFVNEEIVWLQILSFLIAKMAISTSFTIASVYTAEMMPTSMRSGSVGTFSTIARLTSLLAPFIPLLKNFYSFLPLTVFGTFSLAAGFFSLSLPETLGCNLPDTLSEAEEIGS